MADHPLIVQVRNQFGQIFTMTWELWERAKGNPTNPLELVEDSVSTKPIEAVVETETTPQTQTSLPEPEAIEKRVQQLIEKDQKARKRRKGFVKRKPQDRRSNVGRKVVPRQEVERQKLQGFAMKESNGK